MFSGSRREDRFKSWSEITFSVFPFFPPVLTEAHEVFTLPTYFTPHPITSPTAAASLLPFLCKAISSGEPIIFPQHTPALSLSSVKHSAELNMPFTESLMRRAWFHIWTYTAHMGNLWKPLFSFGVLITAADCKWTVYYSSKKLRLSIHSIHKNYTLFGIFEFSLS